MPGCGEAEVNRMRSFWWLGGETLEGGHTAWYGHNEPGLA